MNINNIFPKAAGQKQNAESEERLPLSRQILPTLIQRFCPHCDSVIYSRKSRWCGACGAVLPEDLLFSKFEAASVQTLIKFEKQRHRQWMQKAEAQGPWSFVE